MSTEPSITTPLIHTLISDKYQTVVPASIRHALGLKAGDKLLWRLIKVGKEQKIIAEPAPKHWSIYSLGLGKKIWQNINIGEYINNLRSEWANQK